MYSSVVVGHTLLKLLYYFVVTRTIQVYKISVEFSSTSFDIVHWGTKIFCACEAPVLHFQIIQVNHIIDYIYFWCLTIIKVLNISYLDIEYISEWASVDLHIFIFESRDVACICINIYVTHRVNNSKMYFSLLLQFETN